MTLDCVTFNFTHPIIGRVTVLFAGRIVTATCSVDYSLEWIADIQGPAGYRMVPNRTRARRLAMEVAEAYMNEEPNRRSH